MWVGAWRKKHLNTKSYVFPAKRIKMIGVTNFKGFLSFFLFHIKENSTSGRQHPNSKRTSVPCPGGEGSIPSPGGGGSVPCPGGEGSIPSPGGGGSVLCPGGGGSALCPWCVEVRNSLSSCCQDQWGEKRHDRSPGYNPDERPGSDVPSRSSGGEGFVPGLEDNGSVTCLGGDGCAISYLYEPPEFFTEILVSRSTSSNQKLRLKLPKSYDINFIAMCSYELVNNLIHLI